MDPAFKKVDSPLPREYAEARLTALFHRFAGLSPSSWRTYADLARLARDKYGLDVPPPALPERTLNQGTLPILAPASHLFTSSPYVPEGCIRARCLLWLFTHSSFMPDPRGARGAEGLVAHACKAYV